MSRLFDSYEPRILPRTGKAKTSGLSVISGLEKIAIIEEGDGVKARNSYKLDLSNSIYDKE